MPCYTPLQGFRSKTVTDNGKRKIVFNLDEGYPDLPVTIPCGQCIGCRLEHSRQWAMRCLHEAQLYENNCFITLTYDQEHLPGDLSLDKSHFQKFMKRLRKKYPGEKIRYYHCGEYGEENKRPHYHACLFNHDFQDKQQWTVRNGTKLYVSEELMNLWPYGFSTIGDVTFDSAAYVARYITKKITGKALEETNSQGLKPYELYDSNTGEITKIQSEYTTMSRRPGIGKDWYEKYKDDVYPSDFLVINGKRMRPPKYYDGLLEQEHEEQYDRRKHERRINAKRFKHETTPERLTARHKVKRAQLRQLKRTI